MRVHSLLVAVTVALAGCSQQSPVQPSNAAPGDAGQVTADARLDDTDQGGRPMTVPMTGAEEAPGPGDPDGAGTAVFTFNPGQAMVCFELTVSNIVPATAAHIHRAPVGSPGPIVVGLTPPTSGTSSGCASADRALVIAILEHPEEYYVNVHNAVFPAGAVRGQLAK
jgi:CHRD domain